jgi:hypothetical protein
MFMYVLTPYGNTEIQCCCALCWYGMCWLVQGLKSMVRLVLLPVRVMCMFVHFMCFELQCDWNELKILQKTNSGVAAL